MKDSISQFGVQSWCLRHYKTNQEVASRVREIGLDRVELCGVHADFNRPDLFPEVVKIYQEAGVSIISIGVQTFEGKEEEKKWFECAAQAGAKHLSAHFRIDSFPRAIARVRSWSREFNIKVGIHCHGGYMFGGQPDVLRHLLDLGTPEIGLCIDTAWAMQIGPHQGNPVEWTQKFRGEITGVHFKDFTFKPNGAWSDVVVGTGNLDLSGFVQGLRQNNFHGMAVIEYEADVENPVPALKRCVESMRQMI